MLQEMQWKHQIPTVFVNALEYHIEWNRVLTQPDILVTSRKQKFIDIKWVFKEKEYLYRPSWGQGVSVLFFNL